LPLRDTLTNAAQESVLDGGEAIIAMTARQIIGELYENDGRS